ncbi:phytoene/squalene synthase family protein [Peribacillus psychrosaccharolyticus]|uniref:phytoene/squalene synthase family protein n=1 Tax=Peribacillus psychrosaccharolyticus TaxID=1407 RepID=UPI003D2A4982
MKNSAVMRACEEMMKKGSASFYSAFQHLDYPKREGVFVIYAFCRMIDDSVDEPEQSPYTLIELKEKFTHLEFASGHFIWPSLRWLFKEFPLTKEPFYKQMQGQASDLNFMKYTSMKELEVYCEQVAGSVGQMLLPVLHDQPTKEIEEAGIYLGKAMQIVNIIRDVGEDQERSRRYIPKQLMDKHGYSDSDFSHRLIDDNFTSMINELMNLADRWFIKGMTKLETYPEKSAFCVQLAAGYYAAIMEQVVVNNYQVYKKRAIVTDRKKQEIFLKALTSSVKEASCSVVSREA